jgi:ferrochelatase
MKKTAIVLLNLGGPDSKEAIKPFLYNFFMDPAIINLPYFLRKIIAKRISEKRTKKEAGEGYALLDYKSPLLENTKKQASALEKKLKEQKAEYKVFICMRYWHPMTEETLLKVKNYEPDQVILLPLYPQFSTTTTASSFKKWEEVAKKESFHVPTQKLCCFFLSKGFIEQSAHNIKKAYKTLCEENPGKKPPRVLFSAHGLPEKVIKKGDPYQWQCEESAKEIAIRTGIKNLDWKICYQSKVGPLRWIEPSTDQAIEKAAKEKVPLLVYPHAFVSEHIETLVEIEIEYKEKALSLGVPYFERIDTAGEGERFISGLAELINEAQDKKHLNGCHNERFCPKRFVGCPNLNEEGSV